MSGEQRLREVFTQICEYANECGGRGVIYPEEFEKFFPPETLKAILGDCTCPCHQEGIYCEECCAGAS